MGIESIYGGEEGLYLGLRLMVEVIVSIIVFLAVAGITIYIAGVIWLCLEEKRRPASPEVAKISPRTPTVLSGSAPDTRRASACAVAPAAQM